MKSNLTEVRRKAVATVLGIGFFAADASAFDAPQTTPTTMTTPPPITQPLATPPNASKPPKKDAATRRVTIETANASAQGPKFGVYTPLSSPQISASTAQGVSGLAPGSGMGVGSYPPYGSRFGQGMTPSGTAGGTTGSGSSTGDLAAQGGATGTTPTTPGSEANNAPLGDNTRPATGDTGDSLLGLPNIVGDMGPRVRVSAAPTSPSSPVTVPPPNKVPPRNDVTTFIRVFKISENQSPRPQDRFFYTFNYFTNVNNATNRLDNSPITGIKIYRHVFGFEKTFDEGRGSVGISLPLYNQQANSLIGSGISTPGSTSLGDLNIFTKYILKENKQTGSLVSTGVLFTPPTGTRNLAGANYFRGLPNVFTPVHDLQIQPFLGYIFQRDRFYIQGFAALNVPVSPVDVTQFFNDVQFGYFVFRDRESDRFLTAIIPTFEAHISNPLNHRGVTSPDPAKNFQYDPYGTPDTVNLTYGINFEFRRNSVLTFAFAQPITASRPFDYEAVLLFNYRFGRSRSLVNPPPNVIGG